MLRSLILIYSKSNRKIWKSFDLRMLIFIMSINNQITLYVYFACSKFYKKKKNILLKKIVLMCTLVAEYLYGIMHCIWDIAYDKAMIKHCTITAFSKMILKKASELNIFYFFKTQLVN